MAELADAGCVAFSQAEPLPQRVLQGLVTQAGSQYTVPLPPFATTRRVRSTR